MAYNKHHLNTTFYRDGLILYTKKRSPTPSFIPQYRYHSSKSADPFHSINSYPMWKLNSSQGRQWWTPTTTTDTNLLEQIEQERDHFFQNRYKHHHSSDRILRLLASNNLLDGNPTNGKILPIPSSLSTDSISSTLHRGISFFSTLQCGDGHWPGDYGGPMFLLPGFIISCYITCTPISNEYKKEMIRYLINHQNQDGGFGLHIEHHSTMFATALNYVAMRLLGVDADSQNTINARKWILDHGGAGGAPGWGKFWLAVLGVYDWDGLDPLTPEFWLLPYSLPIHPARFWCHCRVVYLPMSHIYGKKATGPITPLIQSIREEIYLIPYNQINWSSIRGYCCSIDIYTKRPKLQRLLWKSLILYEKIWFPGKNWLRQKAIQETLKLIYHEDESTNWIDIGPVNKTINFLCAWFDNPNSDHVKNHRERLKDYLWLAEDGMKMQGYNGSQLWDTAFTVQAFLSIDRNILQPFTKTLSLAHDYIRITQVRENVSDRERHYRHISKGAWPFSTRAHGWPIADCTGEGLTAAIRLQDNNLGGWIPKTQLINMNHLSDAVEMILGYQNIDGGWATYELTRGPGWLELLNPSEVFGDIMIDYSYPECSSSAMKGLGEFRSAFPNHPLRNKIDDSLQRGLNYLHSQQREDGSWYGSWGICFLYAIWFVIDCYVAMGLTLESSSSMKRACEFVISKQREDGGWGESYLSSELKIYTQSEESLVVSTAWALLVLSLAKWPQMEYLEKAAKFLEKSQLQNGDWPQQNICGVFNRNCMISYSQYRNIFPLWALGEYKKYLTEWKQEM